MSKTSKNQGYGSFTPPKQDKRHPLTRQDTEILYRTACDYPDIEAELAIRAMLDYGLRISEIAHIRSHWIDKEYHRKVGEEVWRIKIPKVEYCWNGKGEVGKGNPDGVDLHTTSEPCQKCRVRSWDDKVDPNDEKKDGWIAAKQAEEYDWSPKTMRSATKVWQFPGIDESAETARKLKQFLETQPHNQWPHTGSAIRHRLDNVVEAARPDDPTDPDPSDLALPDRSQPRVVPHALRHTYGCRLVETGVGEGAGMKQMRHQNAEVFRWYSDVRGTRVVSALNDAVSENDALLHE